MSQPQEQSEAKLLAYIEGDLDADARAEIERHLEANPHHREMLDDLARTRDLVRWLPKESAPPELLEQVQSQLERTSLLDESHGREGGTLRINRWPQIRAVAAVLVMRDIEGFDYQQMADVLGLPLGTLKSRLFRARLALRDELKSYLS